ncbi:MAG: HDIG domain-containing protein [Phycisphaerae bacterium]|nr:HDIG domain-containing protein [Phycisphaerae bacterium]
MLRLRTRLALPVMLPALLTALLAAAIVNMGGEALDYREGQTLDRAMLARVDFRIPDAEGTREKRLQARNSSPNYYLLDQDLIEDIRGRLGNALTLAKTHQAEPEKLREEAAKNQLILDDAGLAELQRLATLEDTSQFGRAVDTAIGLLRVQPLVEASELAGRRTPLNAILTDASRQTQTTLAIGKLLVTDAEAVTKVATPVVDAFPLPLRPSLEKSLIRMLSDGENRRALYRFDSALTASQAEQARAAVPEQFTEIPKSSVIADAGVIGEREFKLIQAEHVAFGEARAAAGNVLGIPWTAGVGRALLAMLAALGVAWHYAIALQKAKRHLFRPVMTAAVLLLLLLVTRVAYVTTNLPPHLAVGAQALAAALLAIAYHRQGSVHPVTLGLALLMTLATQQNLAFMFVLFATSAVLVVALHEVRRRGQIVVAGTGAALVAFVTTVVAGISAQQGVHFVLAEGAWAAGMTLAAAFVIEGLLPAIERIFRISTSMTLLEWCDPSRPLLRMMAADAPGTYNHSLLVGALAVSAADSIEADGLLCRAGAYYHDIGKISKPEYFVENQAMRPNRHDRLSPAMSLLIIIGHVKDGIEMAKEYGLPGSLRPFIAEHHGTTLVQYFYHAASQSRKPDDPAVSDTEFRYPGPKPQSRETAIVMLCDAVEGAVRAMSEPTPGRIEDVVSNIVQKRLVDRQFDDCDLTFREVGTIRASLVKSLCAIYHSRIAYPTSDESKSSSQNIGA